MKAAIVDTNVLVAGLCATSDDSPPYRIVEAMLAARFPVVVSLDLLSEYHGVLTRPRIRGLHGLSTGEVERIIADIADVAVAREPERRDPASDDHLWALLAMVDGAVLVTGDKRVLGQARRGRSVLSPRAFVDLMRI